MSHVISNSQSFTTEKKMCVKDYEQLGRNYLAAEVLKWQKLKLLSTGCCQVCFEGDIAGQLKIWQWFATASNYVRRHWLPFKNFVWKKVLNFWAGSKSEALSTAIWESVKIESVIYYLASHSSYAVKVCILLWEKIANFDLEKCSWRQMKAERYLHEWDKYPCRYCSVRFENKDRN